MNVNYHQDEISLKELILILIGNWKIVLAAVIIALSAAAAYVFLIAGEVYEASLDGSVNETYGVAVQDGKSIAVPNAIDTAYGLYYFPSANVMDYLNSIYSAPVISKTLEELKAGESSARFKDSITIQSEGDSRRFRITVTGSSPEDAADRVRILAKQFADELQITYKERALSYFIQEYSTQAELLNEMLLAQQKRMEDLVAMAEEVPPVVTLQKLITDNPYYAEQIAKDRGISIGDLKGDKMLSEELNPAYITLQESIFDNRKAIFETKQAIDTAVRHLEELNAEYAGVRNYRATGDRSGLDDTMLMFMESKIYLSANPESSDNPAAPQKALTLSVALALGLMAGIFIVFFREYWRREKTQLPIE